MLSKAGNDLILLVTRLSFFSPFKGHFIDILWSTLALTKKLPQRHRNHKLHFLFIWKSLLLTWLSLVQNLGKAQSYFKMLHHFMSRYSNCRCCLLLLLLPVFLPTFLQPRPVKLKEKALYVIEKVKWVIPFTGWAFKLIPKSLKSEIPFVTYARPQFQR